MMYLKHAFEADSIGELVVNILEGNFNLDINAGFSEGVINLVKNILVIDANKRPSIDEILKSKILEKYITLNLIRLCEKLPKSVFEEICKKKKDKNKNEKNKKFLKDK